MLWVWAAPAPPDESTLVIGVSLTQWYHWWWNKIQIFNWDVNNPTPMMRDKINQLLVVLYEDYDEPVVCFAIQDLWWLMILGHIVFDDIHGCTRSLFTVLQYILHVFMWYFMVDTLGHSKYRHERFMCLDKRILRIPTHHALGVW